MTYPNRSPYNIYEDNKLFRSWKDPITGKIHIQRKRQAMPTPIKILTATCGADFDERDIIIVGRTDEGVAKALADRLMRQFDAKPAKDREFWDDDFDRYYESWNINTTGGSLEP